MFEFVALAVTSTGGRPAVERVVALAALGVVVERNPTGAVRWAPTDRFEAVVRPSRRVPKAALERAGLQPDDLDEAPPFAALADELRSFLRGRPIVALDARPLRDLLRREFVRAERPEPAEPAIDLADLADLVGLRLPKPSLAALAAALDLGYPRAGEPRADARATGRIAARLIARLLSAGPMPPAELLARLVRPRDPGPLEQGALAAAPPAAPGIYLFLDAAGEVLYVGKAKSLRQRLASYLRRPLRDERGLAGLAEATRAVRWVEAGSELEALLLEAAAIREHRPRFNAQRERAPARRYLRIDWRQPFPRLEPCVAPQDDGAVYLGPLASAAQAYRAAEVASAIFGLRSCTRALAWPRRRRERPPCRLLAAGRCAGPCTGAEPPERYRERVQGALALLVGQRDAAVGRLRTRMAASAAVGDRAGVAATRALLREAQGLALRPGPPAADLLARPVALLTPGPEPDAAAAHVFVGGRLVACVRLASGDDLGAACAAALARPAPRFPALAPAEEREIVLRWLSSPTARWRLLRLDGPGPRRNASERRPPGSRVAQTRGPLVPER